MCVACDGGCTGVGSKERLTYSEFVEFCLVVAMLNDEDIIKCTTILQAVHIERDTHTHQGDT
jgi:hypothetical protein